ncbi:hypothetical protein HDU99_007495 [Rhizoclosmatium hyalinum]|nr:hypothetical protein HDU99_007495 [Rhizoclosmatium hyalinum]
MGASLMNVKSWLNPVDSSADIKAYESEYVRGTRMWVVEALNEWLDTGERAMWMNGGAGTGKSLIAYSLHNDERKRDPVALVSTIIWNLYTSVKNESFRLHIEAELKADHVRVKDENKQSILRDPVSAFESVVVEGLNKLPMQEQTLLIVIDALDELDILTRKSVLTILTSVCIKLPSFVKILTTGRPESDIYYSLNTLNPFILSPSAENNREDLNIFIRSKVDAMWKRFRPSANADIEKCFNLLVEKSDGLFIYARNICEYLRQQYLTPSASLNVIEEFTMGPDGVYKAILDRAFKNDSTGENCALFRNVFEVILGVQKPLGILSLVNVGNLTESQVETVVAEFRSILKIENGVVSVIHKSVKDYLSDPTRCNASYTIQPIDAVLATRCLEILCSNLHENMANLSPTLDYTPETLSSLNVFPEDVQYAIEYWPTHFHAAFTPSPSPTTPTQSTLLTTLQKFCTTTLPFYLESLLLLTSLPTLFTSITTHIKPRLPKTELVSHTLLTDLLNTATNFRTQIVPSPLQVYRHALLAAPQDTLYARTYAHMVPARMVLGAEPSWGPREFHGHAGTVTSAVYTPDGSAIVSSAQEGGIRVWNGETGECWVTLCGHVRDVTGVKCGGGGVVVSGSLDRSVRVWDLGTGKCVRVWDVGADVFGVDVCGRVVVAGVKDKTVRVWDLEGEREGMVLEGHLGSVRTVAVRWDGKLVVSGGHDHLVKVWSLETGECIHTFEGHGQLVREVVWSTDGTSIVSCSSDKTIKIWDLTSGVCVKTFDDTEGEVFSVALSHDGKIIASASGFQTDIKVWSVETGQVIKVLKGHLLPVWTVSFSIDDRCLVSGSRDRSVRVWNLNDTPLLEGNQEDSTEKQGHHCTIMAIAVSSKSKIVVAGDKEGYIKLWSTVTGHCVKTMKQDIMIRALCISPNEKFIAVGGYDGSVKLWDMESGLCIQEYEGHTKAILAVAFLADAKTVVSSSYDETVRVWSDGNCIDKVSISGDDYDSVFDKLKVVQSSGSTRFWIDFKGWIMLRKRDGTVDRLFDSHMWTTDASDDLLCWTIHAGQKVFALQADTDMI